MKLLADEDGWATVSPSAQLSFADGDGERERERERTHDETTVQADLHENPISSIMKDGEHWFSQSQWDMFTEVT